MNKNRIAVILQIVAAIWPVVVQLIVLCIYTTHSTYIHPKYFVPQAYIVIPIILIIAILLIENKKYRIYSIFLISPILYLFNIFIFELLNVLSQVA